MKVDNFDNYTVLAQPLPEREQRILPCTRGHKHSVDYGAFQIALAEDNVTKSVAILVEHGGGKEAHKLASQWISAAPLLALCETRECDGYIMLFALYEMAQEAERNAVTATTRKYCFAFLEGRLRKRKKQHRLWVEVIPEQVKGE